MMISWGAACMGHAGITNRDQLLALRLILGAFEAGFVPIVFYYLSTLYPHYMLAFRLGLFAGMYSVAGAFSGLIAYGIFHLNSSKYKDWQLLFLIEGGVTLLMALVTLAVLPKSLSSAWFLTPEQRLHAVRRLQLDRPEGSGVENLNNQKLKWINLLDALSDWKKLLTILFNICATMPVYVFGVFMPVIVMGMGYKSVEANLMSVSPFVV
jgi:MFS family permease